MIVIVPPNPGTCHLPSPVSLNTLRGRRDAMSSKHKDEFICTVLCGLKVRVSYSELRTLRDSGEFDESALEDRYQSMKMWEERATRSRQEYEGLEFPALGGDGCLGALKTAEELEIDWLWSCSVGGTWENTPDGEALTSWEP